jgi:hypothetical protein
VPVAAQVLAIFPVLGGISGSTSTICIAIFTTPSHQAKNLLFSCFTNFYCTRYSQKKEDKARTLLYNYSERFNDYGGLL